MTLSITETPNRLTKDIDIADAPGILRLLELADQQMFDGYEDFPGFGSAEFTANLRRAHDLLVTMLADAVENDRRVKIVLSGAGTSGRLAMLLAEEFQPYFKEAAGYPPLDFLIAGGPRALIKAQEGAEDDPIRAMKDLDDVTEGCDGFILIGITCGLSANYISGQLFNTIVQRNQPAFLIGFNPLYSARTAIPENWEFRFADIVGQVQDNQEMVFLNPVVGPEPIAGSTRMKGGTATKIIVEALFGLSLVTLGERLGLPAYDVFGVGSTASFEARVEMVLRLYQAAKASVYARGRDLVPLMESAGRSLNAGGHVVYVGEGSAGKLGIVDASECPPTFGADFSDVRGFIEGGWAAFCPVCEDLAGQGAPYDIGLEDFEERILPGLNATDTLILTGTATFHRRMDNILGPGSKVPVFRILIPDGEPKDTEFDIGLEDFGDWDDVPVQTSMALKLIYNAVTTSAHIFKGKVFENKMIDLRISNNKLYHRCIRILRELAGVDEQAADVALLKSIYRTDAITDAIRSAPVSAHIREAADRERIVPVALVLAARPVAYDEAKRRVEEEHIVRNIIQALHA